MSARNRWSMGFALSSALRERSRRESLLRCPESKPPARPFVSLGFIVTHSPSVSFADSSSRREPLSARNRWSMGFALSPASRELSRRESLCVRAFRGMGFALSSASRERSRRESRLRCRQQSPPTGLWACRGGLVFLEKAYYIQWISSKPKGVSPVEGVPRHWECFACLSQ